MEISDYILLVSAILVAIGWYVTGSLNRKNTIAIRRTEYRMKTLQSFLDVFFFLQKNSNPFTDPLFLPMLEEARRNINIYGIDNEIHTFELAINCLENQDVDGMKDNLNKMVQLVRTSIRKELRIK